jgi:hypothetical protein
LCWHGHILLHTGKVWQEGEVGLLREPGAGRSSLNPGRRLVASAGCLGSRDPEAGVKHIGQGIKQRLHVSVGEGNGVLVSWVMR